MISFELSSSCQFDDTSVKYSLILSRWDQPITGVGLFDKLSKVTGVAHRRNRKYQSKVAVFLCWVLMVVTAVSVCCVL